MKKKIINRMMIIVKYSLLCSCMLVLAHARVDVVIAPFATTLLFACIFLPVKIWVAASTFFLSGLLTDATQTQIFESLDRKSVV